LDSPNKSTPVVVVSALAGDGVSVERVKTLGADAVVAKPVRRRALIAAVKAQLRASA
jgi:DNA-binding response OmpR family regulator